MNGEQPVSYSTEQKPIVQPFNKKRTGLIISSVLAVILVGGIVCGYFFWYQSPEMIFKRMLQKMSEVKSLEYTGQIEIESTLSSKDLLSSALMGDGIILNPEEDSSTEEMSKFSVNFSGASDIQKLSNPKALFNLALSVDDIPGTFGLELRFIEKTLYFNLNNIPYLGFDLSFLTSQWVMVDMQETKETGEPELYPEKKKEIEKVVARSKVVVITEKLPVEKINGTDTYHYKFIIDKQELIMMIADITEILEKTTLTEEERNELAESMKSMESVEGGLWIGKKDLLLYKLNLNSVVAETEDVAYSGNIFMSVQFKNYNKPVQVEIPSGAKPLKEFLGMLFSMIFGPMMGEMGGF